MAIMIIMSALARLVCNGLDRRAPGSQNKWSDFLSKGIYDPRILLHAGAFVLDENYFHTAVKPGMEHFGYNKELGEKYFEYLELVSKEGGMLEITNEVFFTEELFIRAVRQDGCALEFVPKNQQTYQICYEAMHSNDTAVLAYAVEHLQTEELCLKAVQHYGKNLRYVLPQFKTFDVCYAAVQQDGWSLKFVPEHLHLKEMHKAAVRQNGLAIKYVKQQCEDICKIAVQQNAFAISDINYDSRTEEICRLAVQKEKWYMQYAPDHIKRKLEKNE